MKTFILAFLFSVTAQATYLPNDCPLKVAGRCFTKADLDRFESGTTGIVLYSSNATANRGTSFRTAAGTAYQVGGAATLSCKAMIAVNQAAASLGSSKVLLGYSDAAVTFDTASPGTNPIYFGSGTSVASVAAGIGNEKYAEVVFENAWSVPANKYPFYVSTGNEGWAKLYCFIN